MRLFLVLLLAASIAFVSGCKKKQDTLSDSQIPLSIDMIPTSNITNLTNLGANLTLPVLPVNETMAAPVSSGAALQEVAIPQGPYKPAAKEIQSALKNAGFYTGEVDGRIGPKTKKAIEDFQKANNLQADGKVGPKTWALLSAYLNPAPAAAPVVKKK